MIDNLKIWNDVCKTDLKYTKSAKKNRVPFTSISPQYQLKKATQIFGPYGVGFGVVPNSISVTYKELGTTTLLIYNAIMYYVSEYGRGELAISAVQRLCYVTDQGKGYLLIDDDAQRKAETNALSKALSKIGFDANIYMGMHENYDYVQSLKVEQDIENAENRETEINIQKAELLKYTEDILKSFNLESVQDKAVIGLFQRGAKHLTRHLEIKPLHAYTSKLLAKLTLEYNKRIPITNDE